MLSQAKWSEQDRAALQWLLDSREPAIRLMARRDLLDERVDRDHRAEAPEGSHVRRLLTAQHSDGSFGVHP